MASLMKEIRALGYALSKLSAAAKNGQECRLSADETRLLAAHVSWLGKERDTLLSEIPED
ncbi:MAG TPA: hypothetical protein VFA98_11675 [Thermoanaerobaculia bacterium]|jgi:hypothetical protein|nr:hypothetical protein [Thermoanaerobaculia bacterium]